MTGRFDNSFGNTLQWRSHWRLALAAATILAGGALTSPGPALAQTVFLGGSGQSPVTVNLGALNQLGGGYAMGLPMDPPGTPLRSAYVFQELTPPTAPMAAAVTTPTITATTLQTIPEPAPLATLLPVPQPLPVSEPLPTLTVEPAESLPVPEPLPTVTAEAVPEPEPESLTTLTFEPPPLPEFEPEPVAMPEPEPIAAPETETEVAALSPAETADSASSGTLRIEFAGDSPDLPLGADSKLSALAEKLLANESLRAQVKAYAGSSTGSASAARRLSLSRALAVRSVLIEHGVRSTRIDVRALGDRNEGGPPERVDVLLVSR